MSSAPTPIRLTPADAERYLRLRDGMLRDAPWAFDAAPAGDAELDLGRVAASFASERAATFAIEAPPSPEDAGRPALIAAASITRSEGPKFSHRARISAVFVHPSHRGRGLGRAVIGAAIDAARGWGVDYADLGVSENSPEALRLYESFGFRTWGREPEATEHNGRRYDEIHMTLRL
jgi:ribosomal protein S18 acetylase RimI-like enzyme